MDTPGTVLGFLSTPLATHRLHGKVAIITGGAGKIGVEVAGRFLREAANVVLVDTDPFALDAAVEILKGALVTGEVVNGRIHCVLADAATVEGVKHYVQSCLKIFHRLDIAFLNVGIRHPAKSLFQTTEEEYDDIMRVNTKSAFLGIKHAGFAMKELGNGGSIILTSSSEGLHGTAGLIAYSGSKFALRGLALSAASELGGYGIRVNTIHPSGVDTPMFRNTWSSEELEAQKAATPLGRFAQVDDVASVVGFLASEDSKFMTGGLLKIDGGSVSF